MGSRELPVNPILTVATPALLSAFGSGLRDGVWALTQSRRAHWELSRASTVVPNGQNIASAVGGGNWLRSVEALDWAYQTTFEIDPVAGSDDNTGLPGFPLLTIAERTRRVPRVVRSQTTTLLSGVFPASDPLTYQPILEWDATLSVTSPSVTFVGTRSTAAGPFVVATSTPELVNEAPTIDAVAALTVGSIIEVVVGISVGSTAIVCELIGGVGTLYRTTPWISVAGGVVAPPLGGAGNTIRQLTLTSVPQILVTCDATAQIALQNLSCIGAFNTRPGNVVLPRTCQFTPIAFGVDTHTVMASCSIMGVTGAAAISALNAGTRLLLLGCGIIRTGAVSPAVAIANGVSAFLGDTVIQGGGEGLTLGRGGAVGSCVLRALGIFGSTTRALLVERGFWGSVEGTLYGGTNAAPPFQTNALGTLVQHGGHMSVLPGLTPTLAAVASELSIDGAVSPATWAAWVALFGRTVFSGEGSSVLDRT